MSVRASSLDQRIIRECIGGSFSRTMAFPEVVRRLQEIGVSRYVVDLLTREKRHYGADDTAHAEPLPIDWPVEIAATFAPDGVKAALLEVQQGRIGYPEFLRRITAAGTVTYSVFIDGRKAIYTGRDGDFYVEPFPEQV